MTRMFVGSRRLAAVTVLGLAALVTLAASARPDAASAVEALPGAEVSAADLSILVEAAKSCPALTPARLAGQVMAASKFSSDPVSAVSAVGGRGTAGLTPQVWRKWAPWEDAKATDKKASVIALAHGMCDLFGQLRVVKIPGDQWRLALAAHRVGMAPVIDAAAVPASTREYVDVVERYALWYALQPAFGGTGVAAPATVPVGPAITQAPVVRVPDQLLAAVVVAGKSCKAMPPARIAAQIMATSGFDARKLGADGQQGIAQFLPQVWVQYVPTSSATPWDPDAAVSALSTTMCAMIKKTAKVDSENAYALALAAFRRGDESIKTNQDLSGSQPLTQLVDLVKHYETEYAKDTRLTVRTPAPSSSSSAKGTRPGTEAKTPTKKGNPTSSRTNQPPIKGKDGDGSGRVYGPYFIFDNGTAQCVDAPGTGAAKNLDPISQNQCVKDQDDNQEFSFVPRAVDSNGNQLYWIRNIDGGYCLDLMGVDPPKFEDKLVTTDCHDNDNQDWRLQKTITVNKLQYYWIINASSGLCLDVPGEANAWAGVQLQMSPCHANDDDDWSLVQKSEW
jgi:hypothetical protein